MKTVIRNVEKLLRSDEFDTELFINCVRSHPCLWDNDSPHYNDKMERKKSWEDVAVRVCGGRVAERDKREQLIFNLQRRWKSIRDSYSREIRRRNRLGTGLFRKRSYIYSKQLSFLKPATHTTTIQASTSQDISFTNEASDNFDEESNSTHEELEATKKEGRKREDGVDVKDLMENGETCIDEDKLFLLSLLSHLKKVPSHRKLSTKIELMSVIEKNLDFTTTNDPIFVTQDSLKQSPDSPAQCSMDSE